jgi:hypothetical protein
VTREGSWMDRIKRNTKLTVQMELVLVSGRRRAELIKVRARLVTRRASQLVSLTARVGNERADSELQSSQTRASHELRIFCALLNTSVLIRTNLNRIVAVGICERNVWMDHGLMVSANQFSRDY